MTSAEIRVGGAPLAAVNWQNQREAFDAVQGKTKLLVKRFSSDVTGQIWNIEGGDGRSSYRLVIFCLGRKPEEWSVQPVGTALPPKSAIDLIETVITDAQQKNAAHFFSISSE